MNLPSQTRRGFLAAGGALAAASLVGCTPPGPTSQSTPAGQPREIPGLLGTATVPPSPQRVVSIGQYRDTDAAVAVGVVPILSPDLSRFIAGGIAPWVVEALAGRPMPIADVAELPFEQIAGLQPDLILATDRNGLDEDYAKLSQLAPTLSSAAGYNKDPWPVTTARIGEALGRTDAAAQITQQVTDAITAAATDNPQFRGRTFTLGPVTAEGVVNTINSTTDSSAAFLAQLGLQLSPTVTNIPESQIPGRAIISPENLDIIDADIVMLTFNTPDARTRLEANPLFQSIPAVQRGSYIPLDLPPALAIGFPTALSIPWALDRLLPPIKTALTR